ncbi:MAG: hypothetical protein EOP39_02945 [Rubrivivax sp.]|nr:MAG: hypothetical protein EOP39_02945 [Rubrivivax sp.]
MTLRFHWSRFAEVAEAAPLPQVAFPTGEDIALLRKNLRRIRDLLAGPALEPGDAPALKSRRQTKAG